mgnify:CR=1 FL=1
MKKLSKFTALLAATALLFGGMFVSCSSDDDEDDSEVTAVTAVAESSEIEATGTTRLTASVSKKGNPSFNYEWSITSGADSAELSATTGESVTLTGKNSSTENDVDVTVQVKAGGKTNTVTVKVLKVGAQVTAKVTGIASVTAEPTSIAADGKSTITAVATKNGEPTITYTWTITEGDEYATLSSSTSDTVVLTAKSTDSSAAHDVTVSVTASDGENTTEAKTVKVTVAKAEYSGPATTDSWDFTKYADTIFVNPTVSGTLVTDVTSGDAKTAYDKDGTYTLTSDASVKGAEDNLTLTIAATGTGIGVSTKNDTNYSYAEGATSGLRIKNDALKIADVKGKVILTIDWYCIKGKAAGDRNLELTIGDSGTTQSIGIDSTADATETAKMTSIVKEINAGGGTNIYIGASNNVFINKITIAENNAVFAAQTNSVTANDLSTLGLVGTSVTSSDTTVATVAIADGKIAISSVSSGEATLTVTDAKEKTATIAVTVAGSGEITATITKFTRSAPDATVTAKASSATAADGEGTVTWDGLTDLEYSTDDETFVSATDAGLTVTVDEAGTTATITELAAGEYYVRGSASTAYEATESVKVTVSYEGIAKTTDSWDLTKATVEKFTVNAYTPTKVSDTNYTYTAATALSTTAAILAEDYVYAGANGNLNLTLSKYSGTGVGDSKADVSTAPDWTATENNKPGNSVQWKTHNSGLIIKRDGIKISGVKGSVKLTVTFGITSKKDENNRYLEVTVGADGTPVKTSNPVQSTDATTYSVDIEGGAEGVDVYIGASNELYLQSITIE